MSAAVCTDERGESLRGERKSKWVRPNTCIRHNAGMSSSRSLEAECIPTKQEDQLTSFEKKPRLREGACRGRDDLSFKNIKRVDSTEVEGEFADWADCNEANELRLAVIAPLLSSLQSRQLVVGEATKKSNLGSTWSAPLLSRVQPWACYTFSGIHRFLCYLHDLICNYSSATLPFSPPLLSSLFQ